MIVCTLDGNRIASASDFYERLRDHPEIPGYFGANLDALWDTLTGIVALPFRVVWEHAAVSRAAMGEDYERIVAVMREAVDETSGGFTFELLD